MAVQCGASCGSSLLKSRRAATIRRNFFFCVSDFREGQYQPRHSGGGQNPVRAIMQGILNRDPSDRIYVLDSGLRQNDRGRVVLELTQIVSHQLRVDDFGENFW